MQRRSFLKLAIAGLSALVVGIRPRRRSLAVYHVDDVSEQQHVIAWSEADAIEVVREEFGLDREYLQEYEDGDITVRKLDDIELVTVHFESADDYVPKGDPADQTRIYHIHTNSLQVSKHAIDWADHYGRGVLASSCW